MAQGLVPSRLQLSKALHIFKVTEAWRKALARYRINSIVHSNQEHLREVHVAHACTTVAPFTRHSSFHTADSTVVVSIFFQNAFSNKGRNDDFIIIEGRHTEAKLHDFDTLIHKASIQTCMITNGQIRLRKMSLSYRFQHKVGKWVDCISLISRLATDCHILIKGTARR